MVIGKGWVFLLICLAAGALTGTGCATGRPVARPIPPEGKLEEEVKKKWDAPEFSTSLTWVEYAEDLESRSVVDFRKGTIVFEAIVALQAAQSAVPAEEKIADQVKRTLSARAPGGEAILESQVETEGGGAVTPETVEPYIDKVVLPTLRVRSRGYTAKDGVRRVRVTSNVKLVPDHLKIRARRYAKLIREYSRRFGLDPELILSIIHTESYFNPMARSPDGALGLMQLIPRFGGKEAYDFLFKGEKTPTDTFIYDPKNNVALGTAYYHLLEKRYFAEVEDDVKRRYLAICAYNLGPTRIKRWITDRYDVAAMEAAELFRLLKRKTPPETQEYLSDVVNRIDLYKGFFL